MEEEGREKVSTGDVLVEANGRRQPRFARVIESGLA